MTAAGWVLVVGLAVVALIFADVGSWRFRGRRLPHFLLIFWSYVWTLVAGIWIGKEMLL